MVRTRLAEPSTSTSIALVKKDRRVPGLTLADRLALDKKQPSTFPVTCRSTCASTSTSSTNMTSQGSSSEGSSTVLTSSTTGSDDSLGRDGKGLSRLQYQFNTTTAVNRPYHTITAGPSSAAAWKNADSKVLATTVKDDFENDNDLDVNDYEYESVTTTPAGRVRVVPFVQRIVPNPDRDP